MCRVKPAAPESMTVTARFASGVGGRSADAA